MTPALGYWGGTKHLAAAAAVVTMLPSGAHVLSAKHGNWGGWWKEHFSIEEARTANSMETLRAMREKEKEREVQNTTHSWHAWIFPHLPYKHELQNPGEKQGQREWTWHHSHQLILLTTVLFWLPGWGTPSYQKKGFICKALDVRITNQLIISDRTL